MLLVKAKLSSCALGDYIKQNRRYIFDHVAEKPTGRGIEMIEDGGRILEVVNNNDHVDISKVVHDITPLQCQYCSGFEDKLQPQGSFWCQLANTKENDSGASLKIDEPIIDNQFDSEFYESDKHEILVQIAKKLDRGPQGLAVAENIFDEIKYQITRHVLKSEYNCEYPMSTRLALWLDMKIFPLQKRRMARIMRHLFGENPNNHR